jgi:hypothetical protein
MNRLEPLITRLPERAAPVRALALPRDWSNFEMSFAASSGWVQDAKLFATAWLGGLVFFATLLA